MDPFQALSGVNRPRLPPRSGARVKKAGSAGSRLPSNEREVAALVSLAAIILLLLQVGGLTELMRHPEPSPDYFAAAAFVSQHHIAGEPVIVALPPPVYLAMGSATDLVFLPSPLESKRAQRYTRLLPNGDFIDFWLGVPSIVTTAKLCQMLDDFPQLWLIVDETRLKSAQAYAGPMEDVIRGRTTTVFAGKGGVTVRRLLDAGAASEGATLACSGQSLPIVEGS